MTFPLTNRQYRQDDGRTTKSSYKARGLWLSVDARLQIGDCFFANIFANILLFMYQATSSDIDHKFLADSLHPVYPAQKQGSSHTLMHLNIRTERARSKSLVVFKELTWWLAGFGIQVCSVHESWTDLTEGTSLILIE